MCATSIVTYCTSDYQMTFVSNSDDAMFFKYETKEVIELNSPIKDPILKNSFLDLDEKEVDNVSKGG